jgi:hypothetical protein
MPARLDAFVAAAGQHLFKMADAEALAGAIDGGEQFLRDFGRIDHAGRVKAIVAIAARGRRAFAEMAQQYRAAASGGFDQCRQRIDPCFLGKLPRLGLFLQPLAREAEIARRPEKMRNRRVAVAAGAPAFLIIGLDRFGDAGMGDEADIGLVDPHAEGDGCDHHHIFARDKFGLRRSA